MNRAGKFTQLLHLLIIIRPTKEKSQIFLLLYNSLKETADSIEYRANLRTTYINKEFADALNIYICQMFAGCYFQKIYTNQELNTLHNAFLIIIRQKRSGLFYFYVLLLADTIHILKEVADNKNYR